MRLECKKIFVGFPVNFLMITSILSPFTLSMFLCFVHNISQDWCLKKTIFCHFKFLCWIVVEHSWSSDKIISPECFLTLSHIKTPATFLPTSTSSFSLSLISLAFSSLEELNAICKIGNFPMHALPDHLYDC